MRYLISTTVNGIVTVSQQCAGNEVRPTWRPTGGKGTTNASYPRNVQMYC